MVRPLIIFFSIVLWSSAIAITCEFKKDANYYLSLNESEYFAAVTNGNRIGECRIVEAAEGDYCDMYVKSAVLGSDGNRGWPKTKNNIGVGCVKAVDKAKGVNVCIFARSVYSLTKSEVSSFCTMRRKANAVAMSKHALRNNGCNLPSIPPTETCTVADASCPCGKRSSCGFRGQGVEMPKEIRLERVRRCSASSFLCPGVVDNPDNDVFHLLSRNRQKGLFLSQVFKPRREDTKNVILVIAGQQEEINLGFTRIRLFDESNGLTGQQNGYKSLFSRRDGSRMVSVERNSVVQKILSTGYFSANDTFVGLVFDGKFHYGYSRRTKDEQEDAYYKYIKDRMGSVKTVYVGGMGRGGCLAMRVGSRITKEFENARVIVHSFDATCTEGNAWLEREFGVGRPVHINPLNRKYEVYTTDMLERFPNRRCVAIRSFLSGENFVPVLNNIRSFGHRGHIGMKTERQIIKNSSGYSWYIQTFHNVSHNMLDDIFHDEAMNHLIDAFESLPCSCGK